MGGSPVARETQFELLAKFTETMKNTDMFLFEKNGHVRNYSSKQPNPYISLNSNLKTPRKGPHKYI